MRLAFLTTDNRQNYRSFEGTVPHFGTAPEALLQGFAAVPELEVHVVSCAQKPMKSPPKLAENIWFHSLYVPRPGWLQTSYQGCIRAVRRKLKVIQPDMVHGQGTERDCAISAVFSRFPNILTIHGNMRLIAEVNQAKPLSFFWLAAQLEKITLPRTRGVVCITRYTRDAVKDFVRKTWIVPNAVDQAFFSVETETNETRTVLCVGNICLRKNQNFFIQAFDGSVAPPFKLVFLGQAERKDPYVAQFFELLASRPWCEYAGFADRDQLRAYFQGASLLALPSLEDNCPMAVLEAMAAGVPVLAAKVGGLPDLIEEEKNGLFCNPLEAAGIRSGVHRLLDQPALARALAAAARQQARERFHPLVIARRHLEIYQEVLESKSPS
jgi:glycosyltransferase involved in cell wall biosynthesis